MSDTNPRFNALQTTGLIVFTFALIFCSMEVVPEWSRFRLDWPAGRYYALMALVGGLAGMLVGWQYFVPGFFGGLLAGLGGLGAMAFFIERSTYTNNYIFVLVAGLGCLPGVGVGFGLRFLQDLLIPPYTPSRRGEAALPRRRRREVEMEEEERPRRRPDADDRIRRDRGRNPGE